MNDSRFNLQITEDLEDKLTCLNICITPHSNINTNPWPEKSQNVAAENSEIPANQTANKTANEKENEPSKRHESFVVFIGHYPGSEDEPPEYRNDTDSARFKSNDNSKEYVSREPSVEENTLKLEEKFWPQENSFIGTALRMLVDETNTSAHQHQETLWVLDNSYDICESADVNISNIAPSIPRISGDKSLQETTVLQFNESVVGPAVLSKNITVSVL